MISAGREQGWITAGRRQGEITYSRMKRFGGGIKQRDVREGLLAAGRGREEDYSRQGTQGGLLTGNRGLTRRGDYRNGFHHGEGKGGL